LITEAHTCTIDWDFGYDWSRDAFILQKFVAMQKVLNPCYICLSIIHLMLVSLQNTNDH